MPSPYRDPRGLGLAVVFVLVLYWQAVSGHGVLFQRDIFLYWKPHVEWATRVLASGHLPQWNPFNGFGAPFLADPNFQSFYPPSILIWLLPAEIAYSLLVVGHSILGSIGMFVLLKPRLRSRSAALVGAVVFVAAGPIVSSANLWHHFSAAMYMPWVFDAFLRLRSGRGTIRRLACFTALQALAGSADVCAMTGLGLFLFLPSRAKRLVKLAPKLLAALAICVALAAIQWLPAAALAGKSGRSALDPSSRLHWSVSPSSLIDFVLPLTGAAHASPSEAGFLEERLRLIPWMYLGASTLPFLVVGALRAPRLALVLLASILMSLGRHTFIGSWAEFVPVVSMFRFPSKILWFASACWAVLSAIGYQQITRGSGQRVSRAAFAVGAASVALAAGLWSAGPVLATDHADWRLIWGPLPWGPLAFGAAMVAISLGKSGRGLVPWIMACDVVGMGQTYNPYSASDMVSMRPTLVDELRHLNARRVFVALGSGSESRSWKVPTSWTEEEAFSFSQSQVLLPPQMTRWSIKGSFDGDFNGLSTWEYALLCSMSVEEGKMSERLLRLGGVTHAIRFPGPKPPEFPVVAEVKTLHTRPALVLEVPDPLAEVYVVDQIRSVASSRAAADLLADEGFEPSQEIVRVQGNPSSVPLAKVPSFPPEALVKHESEGRMVVRARLSTPGTLVILNAFSEGWRARVNGEPKALLPANLIFQSLDLDAGDYLVELEYQTPGLMVGAWISLLAWGWMAFMLTSTRGSPKT